MMTHYKLPIDTEVDADIVAWINKFSRNKKGEMVRHAIRYYMNVLEEGETIKFPSVSNHQQVRIVADKPVTQSEQNKKERKRPSFGEGLK